jgi:pyruvate-formate lyase-activating enzyme
MVEHSSPQITATIPYDSRVNPYFPHQVLMETTSACQLRCKMCAREDALKRGTLKIGQMEEWLAEKIVNEVASVNPKTRMWFCYFGEPTISKQLWKRIRYAKDNGVETTIINSNGNLLKPAMADQLIESGLDEIYIGLDAASSETYAQVRIRGHYDTVVENIEYLLHHKPDRLKVTVQFGVYEENEHELEGFKKFWADKGVGIFIRPKLTWIGSLSEHYHTQEGRYPCPWIFDSLPIYFNGLVPYCICDWDNRLPSGDIKHQTIAEVWQGAYRNWQNMQLAGRFEELPEFCRACRDWQSKPLQGTLEKIFDHRWTLDDCEWEKPDYVHVN